MDVVQVIRELKAEREVFLCVAAVVDVDFINRVFIQIEVIGPPIRILQRQVIRDQGDEIRTPRLITAEHVEVGTVYFWYFGDKGRFAMA